MPLGLQALELGAYFNLPGNLFGKSIQRSYSFNASFLDNRFNTGGNRQVTGPMPVILPWHFLNITLPTYKFQKEVMLYGQVPFTWPVLDFAGFEITAEFEEDEFGTIEFFISWCQRQIIDNDGYYIPPAQNRIGHLIVEIQDPLGLPVVYYTFKDIYYLTASDPTYSYDSNDSIKRNITFGVDRMETLFTKYSAINGVQKGLTNLVNAI